MIVDCLKVLWSIIFLWIIIFFSEKFKEGPLKEINNRIIYYFTWLWHFGRSISIVGILFGIGLQINIIIFTLFLLFPLGISFEYAKMFYYTTWAVILFGGFMVQIYEVAMLEAKKISRLLLYIVVFILAGNCVYCAIPYIIFFKQFPVLCAFFIVMIMALIIYGFYKIKK